MRLRGGHGGLNPFEQLNSMSVGQQNAFGVGCIILLVFGCLEVCGMLQDRNLVPKTLHRKLTHITVGSMMLTCMSLFPRGGHSWTGRLGVCAFLTLFMIGFALAAYIPDKDLAKLHPMVCIPTFRPFFVCAQDFKKRSSEIHAFKHTPVQIHP